MNEDDLPFDSVVFHLKLLAVCQPGTLLFMASEASVLKPIVAAAWKKSLTPDGTDELHAPAAQHDSSSLTLSLSCHAATASREPAQKVRSFGNRWQTNNTVFPVNRNDLDDLYGIVPTQYSIINCMDRGIGLAAAIAV
jgi:hypothetical protein